jgi:glycosyltransferase involved in cell wall biosynthesis
MPAGSQPIYALEPFFGGSHRQFLQGLDTHLDLNIRILPMSPHHWKWRMHGSATYYADRIRKERLPPGVIFASDFLHLAALRGLVSRPERWSWLLYFHENQLTYPCRQRQERDLTFAHMNIQSALAADSVYFNSAFHRQDFLEAIPGFYRYFADYRPDGIVGRIRNKSEVLPLGLELQRYDTVSAGRAVPDAGIVLWNQRWEHDKNPELFFRILFQLADEDIPFQLIVCGQQFEDYPRIFDSARERLSGRILHWGYANEWRRYAELLHRADIVVSTARHEFFGIAVLEALYCRCYPLFPKRLVYPEYIPADRKKQNLYTSDRDLYRKLKFALTRMADTRNIHFREVAARFDWERMGPLWREALAGN